MLEQQGAAAEVEQLIREFYRIGQEFEKNIQDGVKNNNHLIATTARYVDLALKLKHATADREAVAPAVTEPTTTQTSTWVPMAIRNLSPLEDQTLAKKPLGLEEMETFSHAFLVNTLGGIDWCNGMYWPAAKSKVKVGKYYLADMTVDPFLPKTPGEHGAKIIVVFREAESEHESLDDVPLFVALPQEEQEGKQYYYMGTYTQFRWSDRLDYDRSQEVVPEHVKKHWAGVLAGPKRDKWMTEALRETFWPGWASGARGGGSVSSTNSHTSTIAPDMKLQEMSAGDMCAAFDRVSARRLSCTAKLTSGRPTALTPPACASGGNTSNAAALSATSITCSRRSRSRQVRRAEEKSDGHDRHADGVVHGKGLMVRRTRR